MVTDAVLSRVDVTARLEQLVDGLAALLEGATSPQTRRAYESDFAHFAAWTTAHGLASLPAAPQTVASTSRPNRITYDRRRSYADCP